MVPNNLTIFNLFLMASGTLIAIFNKIPRLKNILDRISPFQQINEGLKKIDPLEYDIPPTDRTLKCTDKGFKELFDIINAEWGPYDLEYDIMYFQHIPGRSKGTSRGNLILVKFDNGIVDSKHPTTRRDLLLAIEDERERQMQVIGAMCGLLGLYFQLLILLGV